MVVRAAALIVLLGMAGCNAPAPPQAPASSAATTGPGADTAAVTTPTHRWEYREGKEYGYSAALSDDDKKAGKAVAEVQMFRFLGEKDGVYRVGFSQNGSTMVAGCANPCQVVKITISSEYSSEVSRVQFNPDTVIGGVLMDAFNGQMDVYSRKAQADETADAQ